MPGLDSDRNAEALKAGRSNVSHLNAVRASGFLSARYRKMWNGMADMQTDVDKVLRALQSKKNLFCADGCARDRW